MFLAIFFLPSVHAQVTDDFSDGNFSENPPWTGHTEHFVVNAAHELQSNATSAISASLFTPSEAVVNASWECRVKVNYPTSASNFAVIYLMSDVDDVSNGFRGYYVQVGNTQDEVSLYFQDGTKKTKIIDGLDKRVDGSTVNVNVKVTRDANGVFNLFSKRTDETDFFHEGSAIHQQVMQTNFFGVGYTCTSTTGKQYFFDDVIVTGEKVPDTEAPQLLSLEMLGNHQLLLLFNEKINFSEAYFEVNTGVGYPEEIHVNTDMQSVTLHFEKAFEKGMIYELYTDRIKDLAGNYAPPTRLLFGLIEDAEPGDLVWNEVMFEHPELASEYVEIFNKSGKVIDLSGFVITTRKTDGTLNTGHKIPQKTLILPQGIVAFCADGELLRNFYGLSSDVNIVSMGWSALNNQTSTLVLSDAQRETVFDELNYHVDWHHRIIKNAKGVALERVHPDLPTQSRDSWHSAASEVNYGTPGYKNSQWRDINVTRENKKQVWLNPEAFSPDNDGVDDLCFVQYELEHPGYVLNATIFNPAGVKVYQLASNQLLANEGHLVWDGRNSSGKIATTGIYILYFEIFHPEKGLRKQFKLPIVLSSR